MNAELQSQTDLLLKALNAGNHTLDTIQLLLTIDVILLVLILIALLLVRFKKR